MAVVGEEVVRIPYDTKVLRKGRVVYVHPLGRYYVVEFEVDGRTYRESFDDRGHR